jgi:putative membrane protein
MKNSMLTLLSAVAIIACKKKETMVVTQSTDSTVVSVPSDSGMTVTDSITVSTTRDVKKLLSDQDKKFAENAAIGGMMEVMMGKLASENAENANVKTLGKMMVNDHTKANDELAKWASGMGYTLPTGLDREKQKKYDELKTKKGAEFDKMYADFMVSDHKEDIKEFKKEASEGSESALKSFAGNTLPTLEHHLMESQKVKEIVK